jgi:hypothetical protein
VQKSLIWSGRTIPIMGPPFWVTSFENPHLRVAGLGIALCSPMAKCYRESVKINLALNGMGAHTFLAHTG